MYWPVGHTCDNFLMVSSVGYGEIIQQKSQVSDQRVQENKNSTRVNLIIPVLVFPTGNNINHDSEALQPLSAESSFEFWEMPIGRPFIVIISFQKIDIVYLTANFVIFVAVMIPLYHYQHRHPHNLVFLGLFTLCLSFSIGVACANTEGMFFWWKCYHCIRAL